MRRLSLLMGLAACLLCATPAQAASVRTFQYLVTGNSFGFQIFDANKMKIVQFLERPYRYTRPQPGQPKAEGFLRRDLAYDIYFGLRAGSSASWLNSTDKSVGYYQESNVIRSTGKVGNVETESFFFAPYGYKGNAMVMLIKATNKGSAAVKVDAFSLFNFHMGGKEGDENPAANNESVTYDTTAKVATETGPGGGILIYVPIAGADKVTCSSSAWNAVANGQDVPVKHSCPNTSDAVNIMQKGLGSLGAGKSAWWGAAILFESSPSNKAAAISRWKTFSGGKGAEKLLTQVMDEWKAWRKPIPKNVVKSAKELAIWRQSEVVLRMGQILEPWSASPKLKNHGMMLASLPPGGWHIGWVRDGIFAVVAMARTGHHEEARKGLEFFLNAEANNYKSYTSNANYRISLTRYFGNGMEEVDYSGQPTPNIEFDGWGMWLWGARVYMDLSGNKTWMSGKTKYNEVIWDVVKTLVAAPLEANLDQTYWIMKPDTSIWEVHWDKRQHFFWTTAAAARGFCDLAAMAERHGKTTEAKKYADLSDKIVKGIRSNFVDSNNVLAGSTEQLAKGKEYRDGATVEAITWDIFKPTDPISISTMKDFSYLKTSLGGYKRIEGSSDPYDINEWIMIDLRAADALRRVGRTAEADALITWVTDQAAVNFNLLPELYDVKSTNGAYAGAIPMVGYGAGAYMMTLLQRAGYGEPRKCLGGAPPKQDAGPPTGDGPVIPSDGPWFPPEEGGINPGSDAGGNNLDKASGLACLCRAGGDGGMPADVALFCLFALGAVVWRRRRSARKPGAGLLTLLALFALLAPAPALAQPEAPGDPEDAALDTPPPPPPGELDAAKAASTEPAKKAPTPVFKKKGKRPNPPTAPGETAPAAATAQQPAPAPKEEEGFWNQVLDTIGFHGYARMPLNMYFGGANDEKGGGTAGPRLPNLVDDDYYLSGFGYTRLHEKDWTQIFLSASSHNVTVTIGMYASLYSTWSNFETSEQWGIAQASLEWEKNFENAVLKRLKVKAGVFWNDFGFLQPYDTYAIGRTHQGGIQLEAEFPWVEVMFGFGAHLPLRSNNTDFTPLVYGSVKIKPPIPVTAAFYVLHEWSNDKPALTNKEDSKMTVVGLEVKAEIPYLKGPLQIIPFAYYNMENVEFLPKTIEVLHAVDGKRMMDHYLGKSSEQGDGSFPYVGAIDFPARLWRGDNTMPILTGPVWLRLFGVVAYVRSPQSDKEPSKNRDKRTYLKWGVEPEVALWPWLHLALRYDRVILDLYDGDNSFRAVSPRLSFKPFKWGDITIMYSRYSYDEKVQLRTGQVAGGIYVPDKDVLKIQASATW